MRNTQHSLSAKLGLIVLMMFIASLGFSQTYLSQDFESAFTGSPGAPTGWTQSRFNIYGDVIPGTLGSNSNKDWEQNTWTGSAWSKIPLTPGTTPTGAQSGTGVLWLNEANWVSQNFVAPGQRRIETPTVNLSTATSPYIRFYLWDNNLVQANALHIVASNDGGTTWQVIAYVNRSFNVTTGTTITSATPWERISAKIPAAYMVANAKFGIQSQGSTTTQNPFIDNFTIEEFTPVTIVSAGSGNWMTPSTWVGGVVPTIDNNVLISAGHTVTMNSNSGRCQNLTVDGNFSYAASAVTNAEILYIYGNLTIDPGGTYTSANAALGVGKQTVVLGSVLNNGTMDFSRGTTSQLALYTNGAATSISGSGVFTSAVGGITGRVDNLNFSNSFGVTVGMTITVPRTLNLIEGPISNGSNLILGFNSIVTTQTIQRGTGTLLSVPTFNVITGARSVSYVGFGLQNMAFLTVNPGNEVEVVSGTHQVTGTLTQNSSFSKTVLTYPLKVGNGVALGTLTMTRGLIVSDATNYLWLSSNVTGATGINQALTTPYNQQGSYVAGPIRVDLPTAASSTRTLPLGFGTNFQPNGIQNTNELTTLTLTSGATGWTAGTQILVEPLSGATGTTTAPATGLFGNQAYRISFIGGTDLSSTSNITMNGFNFPSPPGGGAAFGGLLQDVRIMQSTTLTGGVWTARSLTSGSGSPLLNTVVNRSTTTAAPGPIFPLATNGGVFTWGTVGGLDVGAVSMANPMVQGCYGNPTTVQVNITNYGANTINFSVNNVTVNCSVTGPNPTTFSAVTLSSGTLASGATMAVTVSTTYDMSVAGAYVFAANTVLTGDGTPGNDAMPSFTSTNVPMTATVTPSSPGICNGSSIPLIATPYNVTPSSTYTMTSIPYAALSGGTPVSPTSGDDAVSSAITLPFNFAFFGNYYNTIFIYTNGFVQFGTSTGSTTVYGQMLPNPVAPNNVIGGVWEDLNAGVGAITYFTVGTSPNQVFVVDFNNVPYFSASGNTKFQIQLYESSNVVEVHVFENSNGGVAQTPVLGIENSIGSVAYFPPAHNFTFFNVSPGGSHEAWRFAPDYPLTYSWSPATGLTSTTTANTTASPTSTTTYTVNINGSVCNASASSTVTVNPVPSAPTCTSPSVCGTSSVSLNATNGGGTINWYSAATGGTLLFTGNPYVATYSSTTTVYVEEYNGFCYSTRTPVTVTVSTPPTFTVTNSNPQWCVNAPSSSTLSISTQTGYTFSWLPTTGLTPGTGLGASVSAAPTATTTYTVTATNGVCNANYTTTVSVNPLPAVNVTGSPSSISACPTLGTSTLDPGVSATNYTVTSIPYAPVSGTGTAGPAGDDVLSGAIPIGFNFTFYGVTYTNAYISTNGFISFDPFAGAGCCTGQLLPNASSPNAVVALDWMDLNTGNGGSIDYFSLTSPNRFVVRFNAVATFSASGTVSGEIILYQSGIVEVHNTSITTTGLNQTQGVENALGSLGIASPGRNSSAWNATSDAYRFAPPSTYSFLWSPGGTLSSTSVQNPIASPTTTTTYSVTVTDLNTTCSNSGSTTISVTVPIVVTPVLPYIQSFESGAAGWSAGGTLSTWALGTPAKTTIIGAGDGTQAWVTGGLGTGQYNAGEQSAVTSPCFDLSALSGSGGELKMKIWYESETGWDGANVQYSTNNGATWTVIGAQGDPINWYNNPNSFDFSTSLWLNGAMWSGYFGSGSGGWIDVKHTLPAAALVSGVKFKIAFGADVFTSDGFAFDKVVIQAPQPDMLTSYIFAPMYVPKDLMIPTDVWVTNSGTPTLVSTPNETRLINGSTVVNGVTTNLPPMGSGVTDSLRIFVPHPAGSSWTGNMHNRVYEPGDADASNDSLVYFRTTSSIGDSIYGYDDNTLETEIGWGGGTGRFGQMIHLSNQDTMTSFRVTWGLIGVSNPDNFAFEIWNVDPVNHMPSTLLMTVYNGIITSANTHQALSYYPATPTILPAGDYFCAINEISGSGGTFILGADGTGFTSQNYPKKTFYYSNTGAPGSWGTFEDISLYYGLMMRIDFGKPCYNSATLSGSQQICPGQSITIPCTFTGTGPWHFTLFNGTNSAVYTSNTPTYNVIIVSTNPMYSTVSTNYYITSVSDANCTHTGSGSRAVIVNPAPNVNATATPQNICTGNTSQLDAGSVAAPVPYCTPTYSTGTGFGDYLDNVSLGSINNTTGPSSSPFYTYYNLLSTTLAAGSTYTMNVVCGTWIANDVAVFIDFDHDGVFSAGERVGQTNDIAAGPTVGSITFTVPTGALSGTTRMRVREGDTGNTPMDPCASISFGEAEDYNVNITGGATITYQWTPFAPTGILTPSSLVASPVAHPSATTLFHVTVTNSGSGCHSSDTVTVYVGNTISANITGNTNLCPGNSTTLTANALGGGGGYTYSWTPGGATTQSITVSPIVNTTYSCTITGSCVGANTTVSTTVNLLNITAPTAVNGSNCGAGTVTIGATGSTGNYEWYTAPTGGTAIGVGSPFTTPSLTTTTTYYAGAYAPQPPTSCHTGPANNSIGSGAQYSNYPDGVIFDVNGASYNIDTVYVYPGSAGIVSVRIMNSGFSVLYTANVTVSAASVGLKTPIPVNYLIAPGTGYMMDAVGSTVTSMWRSSAGAVYPYTSSCSGVSLTGAINGLTTRIYFFYDWRISGAHCNGPRVPVVATILPLQNVTLGSSATMVCPGSNVVVLNANVTGGAGGPYNYSWTGTGVVNVNASTTTATVNATGIYTVTVTDVNTLCSRTANITIVANPAPSLSVTATPNNVAQCPGSTVQLNAIANAPATTVTYVRNTTKPILDFTTTLDTITASGISPSVLATGMLTEVGIRIDHTFDSDMDIYLISPSGVAYQMDLSTGNGGAGDNFGTGTGPFVYTKFTYLSSNPISNVINQPPYTGGPYAPDGSFAQVNGGNSNGFWQLYIHDNFGGDQGNLLGWYIKMVSQANLVYSWAPPASLTSAIIANPVATPTANTTYTVTVTNTVTGCSSTGIKTVPVLSNPSASITGTTTICGGQSAILTVTLTGGGPYSFTLFDGTNSTVYTSNSNVKYVTVTPPVGTTTYTITAVSNACPNPGGGGTGSAVVTVMAPPVGGTTAINGNSSTVVCNGNTATISLSGSTGNITWQTSLTPGGPWSTAPGSTNSTSYTTPAITTNTYFRALLSNSSCYDIASTSVAVYLSSPIVVTASAITSSSATIAWTPYSLAPNGNYTVTYTGGSPITNATSPLTLTGLASGSPITITVTENVPSCGNTGNILINTQCAAPNPVTTSNPTSTGMTVSWANVGAPSYTLYYKFMGANAPWLSITGLTSTSYTFTTTPALLPGSPYAFYVVATGCTGGSQASSYAYGATNGNTCSPSPTAISLSSTCANKITATVTGGGSSLIYMIRKISPVVGPWYGFNSSSSSYTITIPGIPAGNETYEVYAKTQCSTTSFSLATPIAQVTTPALCPAVTNLVASLPTCKGFTLTWNANSCATNGYQIYYQKQGGAFPWYGYTVAPGTTVFTFNVLTTGTYECYVVALGCNNLISAQSAHVNIATLSIGCKEDGDSNNGPQEITSGVDTDNNLTVFPNPNSGDFNVQMILGSNVDQVSLEVLNVLGQVIYSSIPSVQNGIFSETVDLGASASSGIYFVRIFVDGKEYLRKVMVSK